MCRTMINSDSADRSAISLTVQHPFRTTASRIQVTLENMQNRDTGAIQVKPDEIIRVPAGAPNELIDPEKQSDDLLGQFRPNMTNSQLQLGNIWLSSLSTLNRLMCR